MKLQYSVIALAMLAMGAAHAGTPLLPSDAATATAAGNAVYVSGSSALRFSMASGFVAMCDSTTIMVFGNTNGSSAPGNNVRAYACTLKTAIAPKSGGGTAFAAGTNVVFNKYDQGGSINGIQPLVLNTALNYMSFSSCTSTGLVRSGSFDLTKIDYSCAQTNPVVPQMGVSDVEAATIQNSSNLADNVSAVATTSLTGGVHSVAMAGVAVNLTLYRALQAAQGLTQDDTQADAPSLPVGLLAAIESGNASPQNGTGFNTLIPSDGTTSATDSAQQAITFCSRVNGSGTKAMHNAFLLSTPCSAVGVQPVGGNTHVATTIGSPIETGNADATVTLNSSTGNVIACMQYATTDAAKTSAGFYRNWAIGLVGSENDPNAGTSSDAGWRFVKVNGAYPSQANGQVAGYPMTYENFMYWPAKGLATKISQFAKWLQNDAVTPLAISTTPDVGTRQGILANSNFDITSPTYSGVTAWISRTTRGGSSCAPQQIVQ